MDTSYIKISVKPFERNFDNYFEFVIPIDQGLLQEIQEPIHEVDDDLQLFYIGTEVPKPVMLERQIKIREYRNYWSKKLSKIITEKIIESLESNDTINGYMKKDL